jgi:IclR family transcriptional regulator, acetate operon repressor
VAIELLQLGALERRKGGYSLGPRLFELGQLVPRQRRLREVHGHRRASSPAARGGRMPFHCTGLGKAIVAFAPPDVVAQVLARPLPPRTPRRITDRALLRADLAQIRREGVAFDRGESERSLIGAAAPIVKADGIALAGIAVAMGQHRGLGLKRFAAVVKRAADAISADLRTRFIA